MFRGLLWETQHLDVQVWDLTEHTVPSIPTVSLFEFRRRREAQTKRYREDDTILVIISQW
jgi:hypothetical protein